MQTDGTITYWRTRWGRSWGVTCKSTNLAAFSPSLKSGFISSRRTGSSVSSNDWNTVRAKTHHRCNAITFARKTRLKKANCCNPVHAPCKGVPSISRYRCGLHTHLLQVWICKKRYKPSSFKYYFSTYFFKIYNPSKMQLNSWDIMLRRWSNNRIPPSTNYWPLANCNYSFSLSCLMHVRINICLSYVVCWRRTLS